MVLSPYSAVPKAASCPSKSLNESEGAPPRFPQSRRKQCWYPTQQLPLCHSVTVSNQKMVWVLLLLLHHHLLLQFPTFIFFLSLLFDIFLKQFLCYFPQSFFIPLFLLLSCFIFLSKTPPQTYPLWNTCCFLFCCFVVISLVCSWFVLF